MNFDFSNLTREECKEVIKAARERLRRIRCADPLVYGVKRIYKGKTQYNTNVPGYGWRQVCAFDLDHWALQVYSLRENAEDQRDGMAKPDPGGRLDAVWEVYTIPKVEFMKLRAFKEYEKYEEFWAPGTYQGDSDALDK